MRPGCAVTPRDACPADADLAGRSGRHWPHVLVHDMYLSVCDRLSNRRPLFSALVWIYDPGRGDDRTLCWTIVVHENERQFGRRIVMQGIGARQHAS